MARTNNKSRVPSLEKKVETNNDPETFSLISKEEYRQKYGLEMIPSENHSSRDVRQAQGCIMMDKYAEGYPGKRYYGGCEFHDQMENLAIKRAMKLYDAEHANVQPHAGSQANMAAYDALLQPEDTILAMDLSHGGHLTHGSKVNFSGKMYNFIPYQVDNDSNLLNYKQIRQLAKKERPKAIIAGYTAYPRVIDFKAFREIADEVGAYLYVDMAHIAGLIAGKAHSSPIPYADIVTSTTHKTLRGPRGGLILCKKEYAQAVDKAVFPGLQGGPFMNSIAAKAVCFKEALSSKFEEYASQIVSNSRALASSLKEEGFNLVSGGSDNHLLLINLTEEGITGEEAQTILDSVGISTNKNTVPFDPSTPFNPSGIRIGTPAITTRGMKENEMKIIGKMYEKVLRNIKDEGILNQVKNDVKDLASKFPLPD